ncbi:MAG TPA: VIT family protein [Gammaproteobacteria bacterium]|nr:VIT family protein [Gammaproteobacteria bacterium]HQY22346.1 VIT family protein [Gammaproteobacteria bacterium]HRA42081.1 VIT family protein [Gammaproteobacteria bacterium]
MYFSKFITEQHRSARIGWLRAAVLGANDGIISTASLIVGITAAHTPHHSILIAGVASLIAGSMSMAAGEYVSVSSQLDTEQADIERERIELENNLEYEHEELANIYISRGLQSSLAKQVAAELMAHDALGAHARDELGITETLKARPLQAAITSAITFSVGAALPLLMVIVAPFTQLIPAVSGISLLSLALLGALASFTGGSNMLTGTMRVTLWGALALATTTGIGMLF